ncbi:Rossmann fold nucleotide-binding protein Smf [Liberibacter crescens BT-1]|uniref:Rossmann fold nucleotide-binding protein Smf n=1 Tax=Liberibacter crescens (strain BT-1) TaxID=1215343 RepID=L0EVR6_LIBCB|nr:DNA-processing protein DprA [Liberibacter crescens]AGA64950.1 Rossmann fold nucleotide-binding protein Smf [Liberibacter crescens BT-1]AMC12971.1 DNA transporter [Liberibacter crescens]
MIDIPSKPKGVPLTPEQRIAWLRLIRSDNVGPATFRDIINHCGSAERALEMLPEFSRRGGAMKKINIFSREEAEKELEIADSFGAHFVGLGEPDYPVALRYIDSPPPLLAVKGEIRTSTLPTIGVVGARNASIGGLKFTTFICQGIIKAGYVIISGLARGIDTAAHRASLNSGTIVAMAGGLDCSYPPENISLLEEIWNGVGLAISEMPFGWIPRARDFPRRNRLIAGVGIGLIVIEAAKRSGSLITARLAGEFGRIVFAVPGSPLDPRYEGTNALIKDGAILITSPEEVIDALNPQIEKNFFSSPYLVETIEEKSSMDMLKPSENERTKIAQSLSCAPIYIDDIIEHTGVEANIIYLVLLELELAGRLYRHPGGMVSLNMTLI